MTRAYIRDQLIERDVSLPVIMIGGSYMEIPLQWALTSFECLQPDAWDEREWNLILVHPVFGVFFGQSIDFDFTEN